MADVRQVMLTEFLHQKASARKIPISGAFELTPMCNFACRMCYVRKTALEVKASPRPMMKSQQWLEIAEQASKVGMLFLLLTGGEPFSWPGFRELYEKLVRMGLFVSINTNGSLIDENTVSWLRKLPPRRVNLTIYGASDESYNRLCGVHGMYDRVIRAIDLLQKAGIMIRLNCSLTPENVGDLEAIVEFAKNRKLVLSASTYMFPPLRRDEQMVGKNERFSPEETAEYQEKIFRLQNGEKLYQSRMKAIREGSIPPPGLDESCVDPIDGKVRCRAGSASFWITWDGWMMPCGMMNGPKTDAVQLPFPEAWQTTVQATEEIRLSGVCAKCKDALLCHACAAMAQTETGSFSGIPTYLCRKVQAMKEIAERELSEGCKQ